MTTYAPIVVALLAVATLLLFTGAAVRARRTGTAMPVVRVAWVLSGTWAVWTLLGAILVTVLWFTPNAYPTFHVRTNSFWPTEEWGGGGATPQGDEIFVFDGFTRADLSVSGLTLATRGTLAAGDFVGSLVTVALATFIAVACRRLLQGRPFSPEISRLGLLAAGVCLIGGTGSQILLELGGRAALEEIIAAGAAPDGMSPRASLSIDFWPVFAAVGLGAFAVMMRYGSTLQRETEGLV